jgi:hypothetical protein
MVTSVIFTALTGLQFWNDQGWGEGEENVKYNFLSTYYMLDSVLVFFFFLMNYLI